MGKGSEESVSQGLKESSEMLLEAEKKVTRSCRSGGRGLLVAESLATPSPAVTQKSRKNTLMV